MKKVIALGTENKTTFSGITEKGLYTSEPAGDITDVAQLAAYELAVREYIKNNNMSPDYIACDAHPDYSSTTLARKIHGEYRGSQVIPVQHHFAHVVSCMEDNGLEGEVVGVSFDGTGYGTDGKSWGGEFLTCTRKGFTRRYHLKYIPQPGGDMAAREGWRMAMAYLIDAYGEDLDTSVNPIMMRVGKAKTDMIRQMIQQDVNCPLTSSAGRLFDAVSSMLGICDESTYEAEAAILLEKEAIAGTYSYYSYNINGEEIDLSPMIKQMNYELGLCVSRRVISARFHNTLGEIIFEVSRKISNESDRRDVVVSGGCFQNRYLIDYIKQKFDGSGLDLYTHKNISTTDLGVSVGQAVVAANSEG